MADISLPNGWRPRLYQERLWDYLSRGGKRAVAKWHRRSGKDDVFLHHVACAAHERTGNYWYMLPEYSQARKSMWEAVNPHSGKKRIDEAFPHELRRTTRNNEMAIEFHCGSTFQLVGSDNFNSLVGSPPVGLIFSEYALADPSAWGFLRPILLENGGWAGFNSTPRGKNHFKNLCDLAESRMLFDEDGSVSTKGWFYESLTNDDTLVFSPQQMEDELTEMQSDHGEAYGRSLFLQEYFVSFDAAIPGSIFGDVMQIAKDSGRITVDVPYERGRPVHTGWDLGRTDHTIIWYFQVFGGEVRCIDYHASTLKDVDFYAEELLKKQKDRGFVYGTHYLPHDAKPRTLAAGAGSVLQQFQAYNKKSHVSGKLGKFVIARKLDKMEQIQAARSTLKRTWFDSGRCSHGIEALVHYHRKWDAELRVFSTEAVHDWASHPADAFMTLSVAWKAARVQAEADGDYLPSPARLLSGSVGAQSFGAIKKSHLAKQRAKRLGYT